MIEPKKTDAKFTGFVKVKGAREHNLKNISLEIPRDALVVFTGVSGSGKSSLAFGTLYAEAQRRYLESVSPYARRLFHQMQVPDVDSIDGLPPAVALQQQRGGTSTRSSVGSVTTLSNLVRMLYSRAGDYPKGQTILYAESFSSNTPEGACPQCHGLGRIYEITEATMVPDDSLTIRERAIAAWPSAWQGQNLREILMTLGYDVDTPWNQLSKKDRDWILFTDEQPTVPVYSGFNAAQVKQALKQKLEPSYMGTFTGARKYVQHTFANTQSQLMKKRVARYMLSTDCPTCNAKKLRPESLSIKFAGKDIAELSSIPLKQLSALLEPYTEKEKIDAGDPTNREKRIVTYTIACDLFSRLKVLLDLGLGYLSLERSTPTLSPGELQRLRLATQVYSNLFGVVYVLDEPSAGLHPSDTEALMNALDKLKAAGNTLFVVEHELEVIKRADWIVDVGPGAGEKGGKILYSGLPAGLHKIEASKTRLYLQEDFRSTDKDARIPSGWLKLRNVSRNNLAGLNVDLPLGVLCCITGVSGSGKSTLVSQVLIELLQEKLGLDSTSASEDEADPLLDAEQIITEGSIVEGMEHIKRLVQVDQRPIGRTPRSNLATYTGLFDHVRKLFANTSAAKAKHFDAGRFSFNVSKGRCAHCAGEGFVMVELLFLPSVYSPCPTCKGSRYNDKTLEVKYRDKNIAEVLSLTVGDALEFFSGEPAISRALKVLDEVGLNYLRLGQPATELSGGEAQRIKLATELQRINNGNTVYILDEPTTGLHPFDVEKLTAQLNRLVDAGNSVLVVEHDMQLVASSDYVIDMGPGAGDEGGRIVIAGQPAEIAASKQSKTGIYLAPVLNKKASSY